MIGYYHHKLKICLCSTCKTGDNIATMKLPYACKLLFQVIFSMFICLTTILDVGFLFLVSFAICTYDGFTARSPTSEELFQVVILDSTPGFLNSIIIGLLAGASIYEYCAPLAPVRSMSCSSSNAIHQLYVQF